VFFFNASNKMFYQSITKINDTEPKCHHKYYTYP
jgi:hypothetical protein